jgi:hypothetical protein
MSALLIDDANSEDNWSEVLALWSRLANWTHYKPSERVLKGEIKQFLVALWNEKDWLKHQYPNRARDIEKFINQSRYLPVVGDLANMAKHRRLSRPRSSAAQTHYFGRVSLNNGAARQMHYIAVGDGEHIEIMVLLRKALDELEEYRFELLAEAKRNGL